MSAEVMGEKEAADNLVEEVNRAYHKRRDLLEAEKGRQDKIASLRREVTDLEQAHRPLDQGLDQRQVHLKASMHKQTEAAISMETEAGELGGFASIAVLRISSLKIIKY
jgi:response regulator of citrate/malate metabolism